MVRQHQTTAAVAIILALTASLAASASAAAAPAAATVAATPAGASTTVRPNPDEQAVAGAGAVSALASSAAPCGDVCSGHGYGLVDTAAEVASSKPVTHPTQASAPASCGDVCSGHGYGSASPQPTIAQVTSGGGFHWGDAGIGAGACVVLLGIGLVSTRLLTKGRKRHHAEQRMAATS